MFRTRWIRKALYLPYSLGQRCRQVTKSRKPVCLMLESLEDRVTPCDATTLVPGNVDLNFYGHDHSPACIIPVEVNDNVGGVAKSGTVTVNLVSGNTTTVLGSATVGANGIANVNVDLGKLPDNLLTGKYQLEESFSGNADYFACNGIGTLTITTLSTSVSAVTVTIGYSNPGSVSEVGSEAIPIGVDAGNYAVLYEGSGGHTLHIANATITGNVGVGGTGVVHINGPGAIIGTLDFSGSGEGQIHDTSKLTIGPSAIDLNDAAVANALHAINALSSSLAGLGTPISINGTQTINESDGLLVTVNGVKYRVFAVTSFNMDNKDVLTIKGDGSGTPVVFNFGGKGDVNLGGSVTLANGLTPDQVLWNITGIGDHVHLAGNASNSPTAAFQGIILAPNDTISLDNAKLIGRVFGGDHDDLQINGGSTITAPSTVATIPIPTAPSFTISVPVNCATTSVVGGTVTLELVANNKTITLGSGTVAANGVATITVTDKTILQELAALPPGSYELIENFSGSGPFAGSSTTSTFTISSVPTTIVVPSVNVTVNNNTSFNINVNVNSPNGPVTSGTVTVDLVNGDTTIPLGTATLGVNGTFTLNVTGVPLSLLSTLPTGQYQLVINYGGGSGSANSGSSTTGTLTIQPSVQPNANSTTPSTTILLPGGGVISFEGGQTTIPVVVNGPSGPVSEGTVTISLVTPNGSTVIGSAPVSGGTAAVPVTVPSGLAPGSYSLVESYTDGNGNFGGSNGTGALSVQGLNPVLAAIELALDAAMIGNMGNPGSVGELEMFAQAFLHKSIPTSIPQLLSNIQSLVPQAGDMLWPALGFASFLDQDLPIENPM